MTTTYWNRILIALALCISASLSGLTGIAQAAAPRHGDGPVGHDSAEATFTVRVIIEEILATNNFDGDPFFDKADFFAVARINSTLLTSPGSSNDQNPKPNWELSTAVTVPSFSADAISVTIDIRDSDNCGTAPTCGDQADITGDANRELNLTVDLSTCANPAATNQITGALTANCGQTVETAGTTGSGTFNTAVLKFRIVVDAPASAPGLNVRASHNTLWPQGGESVVITAEALDDSEALARRLVSRIEIWSDNVLVRTCFDNPCTFTRVAPPAGSSITYKADVVDGSTVVSTGWRRVQVGQPPEGRAVPVLFTGPRSSRVDIALVPAMGSYTSANTAAFRTDALNGVLAFYSRRWLLKNQDKFNFWIAPDFGVANGFGNGSPCVGEPGNWGSTYAFIESGAVIHTNSLRDCARPSSRIYSAEPGDQNVMLHEAGHAAFGLADEYCCDSFYFQPDPLPNIYSSLAGCQNDILQLQPFDPRIGVPVRTGTSCRQIVAGPQSIPWFKSDPEDDLMNGNGRIQGADLRRMEWFFNELCVRAACGPGASSASFGREGALTADQAPAFDYGSTAKLVNLRAQASNPVTLTLTGGSNTSSVAYGQIASSFQSPDMLRVQGVNISGSVLYEGRMWQPLLEKGWVVTGPVEFPTRVHGGDQLVASAQTTMTVPFSAQLRRVRVLGTNGQPLLDVDVLPAMQAFCAANISDADCAAVPKAALKVYLPLSQR